MSDPGDACGWPSLDAGTAERSDLTDGLGPAGRTGAAVDAGRCGARLAADDQGRAPVFRVDARERRVTRLTGDDGAYTDVSVSPDGRCLRAALGGRLARRARSGSTRRPRDQDRAAARARRRARRCPARWRRSTATAEDGTPLRAWLALPDGASAQTPAPLLLWIHGGPLRIWNAWSWRWNPWLMAARGYAVLLPDPALSTGYGQRFIRRGWGDWGRRRTPTSWRSPTPRCERPDIDASGPPRWAARSAATWPTGWPGTPTGSAAIVTHASLWALDQFAGTTDDAVLLAARVRRPARAERYGQLARTGSPTQIRTPMLVIHGDKDYRVPIGEALRLWCGPARVRGRRSRKFLYFPDENHWILKPQQRRRSGTRRSSPSSTARARQEWQRPDILG